MGGNHPMNGVLWGAQMLLAIGFLATGFAHAFAARDRLAKQLSWINAVPLPFLRFIGVSELLGAIGLILPMLTGIVPRLVVAAAGGLAIVMLSAIVFHARRQEYRALAPNVVLLALALFVVIGRVAIVQP